MAIIVCRTFIIYVKNVLTINRASDIHYLFLYHSSFFSYFKQGDRGQKGPAGHPGRIGRKVRECLSSTISGRGGSIDIILLRWMMDDLMLCKHCMIGYSNHFT